jgi:hypothetical protein
MLDPLVLNVHPVLCQRACLTCKALECDTTVAIFFFLGVVRGRNANVVNLRLGTATQKIAKEWETAPKKKIHATILIATLLVFPSLFPLDRVPPHYARTPAHFTAQPDFTLRDAVAQPVWAFVAPCLPATRGSCRKARVHGVVVVVRKVERSIHLV